MSQTHTEQLAEEESREESGEEFSETYEGRQALDRWAQDHA